MDGDSDACDSIQDLGNGGNMYQEECQQVLLSTLSPPAMSQWTKVQKNPAIFKEVQQHYPEHFPMEVRYFLCQWIEEQQWDLIEETNTEYAEKVLIDMMELLNHKIGELDNPEFFLIRVKLEETVTKLQDIIKTRPYDMIQTITRCLAIEESLIEQLEQQSPKQTQMNHCPITDDEQAYGDRIMRDVKSLLHQTKMTDNDLKNLQQKQESFIIQFSDSQRITGQLHHLNGMQETAEVAQKKNLLKTQKDKIDVHLTTLAQELYSLRIDLAKKYVKTIDSLTELQHQVLDNALISWKRKQQLAGNGLDMSTTNLDTLQKWCESLADLIWNNRQQMKKAMQLQQQLPIKFLEGEEDLLPKLNETITTILSSLVTSTFVVEKQPPQVLKKDARFSAIVRFLVGGKLNVHMNPPQVKATIISEQQATVLLKANSDLKIKNNTSGEILNNMGIMEYQPANGKLSIHFKNMQLKKIKRADKKGSEAVTEEKFCIWFQSEFSIGGNELVFQVWTLSLPVVVTVHGNQECNATATILWDNAFAEPARVPFSVPDTVNWKMLSEQLNIKFKSYTGKGLSDTNLSYIAFKLFGNKDPSTCKVTWSLFNKDTLSNRNFTFWEWFYAIQKLTKEHLKDLWTDNAIIGFVSKKQAENWLNKQPIGTFLLRFSDSELGGITIAWTGEKEVLNLAPFQSKDFSIRGLADRIKDLNDLVTLYPNRLKEDVFSKYYSSTNENVNKDGYIHPLLKTTIPRQYKSTTDADIKQPLSQDSTYDLNLNSVQEMDESIFTPIGEIPSELAEMDFSQFTDYTPEDIDEINVEVIAM